MLFQITRLRKGHIAYFTHKRLTLRMFSEMVFYITCFGELHVTPLVNAFVYDIIPVCTLIQNMRCLVPVLRNVFQLIQLFEINLLFCIGLCLKITCLRSLTQQKSLSATGI
jgi:hypothetical protein